MRAESQIVAERALARHSGKLVAEAPAPGELLPLLSAMGESFAHYFGRGLAPLLGGNKAKVRCSEQRECMMIEFGAGVASLAANCLLSAGSPDATMLLTIDARAVLQLIDRTFGGRGKVPAQLPTQFPVSGDLLTAKLEAIACQALTSALGGTVAIGTLRREGSLSKLQPFPEMADLAVLDFEISEEGFEYWHASLAIPMETLAALFGVTGSAPAPKHLEGPSEPQALAAPFDEIPMDLRAVLVDMKVPVSRLSTLAPGQLIPVAVARSVPLRVGEETFAHGTIGTLDDRIAVRVTQAFQQQEPTR